MPPLGTKLPANRSKKPPSCDHCKRKRVLCHPNPAGCPRCVEKGLECTTTPVIRRKPTRRSRGEASVEAGTLSTSTSPRASTVDLLDLPIPPVSTGEPANRPLRDATGAYTPYAPTPSTSNYVYEPTAAQALDSVQLVSLHYSQCSLSVGPELAEHLFATFSQIPQHEHPIFASYTLERTLQTLGWQVDLLPSHSNVLAYCIFAVASLFSYHVSILDPYHLSLGGACPTSFLAVLDHLPDLRKFGKLRAAACQGYREEALRRAKESDIMFVASEEAATACHLIKWLEAVSRSGTWLVQLGGHHSSFTVWHAAEMSHLRVLGRGTALPPTELAIRWACYMLIDSMQALFIEQNPTSLHDQLMLIGSDKYSEIDVDRDLERNAEPNNAWPFATPHIVLGLELCRRVSEELVGPWNRDQPFQFEKVSAILDSIERRRRCAEALTSSIDHTLSTKVPVVPLHHFPSLVGQDPVSRYRNNTATSLRSYRMIIQTPWAYTALIVYNHLRKRHMNLQPSFTSRATPPSSNRYLESRLDFAVRESRQLALDGLAATIDALDNLSALAAWTHLLPTGFEKWAQFLLTELDHGLVVLDAKIITLMEKLSDGMKQVGYVWASASRDSLILTLDSHILAYQLATTNSRTTQASDSCPTVHGTSYSTSVPGSFGPRQPASSSSTFDPSLSLFANITTLSTPSDSASNDPSPSLVANPPLRVPNPNHESPTTNSLAQPSSSCATPSMTTGQGTIRMDMRDFSDSLGLGTY